MTGLRVGVGSYAFPRMIAAGKMDLDGLLLYAAKRGLDAVQCCENLPWPSNKAVPKGLIIETGCRGIGDHLLQHLELAQQHRSGFVRLVIDDEEDQPSFEEAVQRLRPYAQRFREAGVTLGIENHDRFPSRMLRELVEELGRDWAGIVLDTANSLGCLEGIETVVDTLGPYVVNLHAKDVRAVRKPDMLGFDIVGTPFGAGDIDFDSILPRLPRLVSITLEQWVPGSWELETSWADEGIPRMRTWVDLDFQALTRGAAALREPFRREAGRFSLEVDLDAGMIRDIRLDGQEVIRAVYGTIRDASWGTPKGPFEGTEDGISGTVERFAWTTKLDFTADEIVITFEGEALERLETNRAGLCLLHPPSAAGQPCVVTHSDGSKEASTFPNLIAPHQPFFDIAAIESGGVRVEFEGEIFEMEDQRNWTDASFKTYCRPVDWPRPYRLEAGDRVRQRIRITAVEGSPFPPPKPLPEPRWIPLPAFGGEGETFDFTHLNRNREGGDIAFSLCPQVHAFDVRTIIESLEIQPICVETARSFADGDIHVGPILFDRDGSDPRFESLFGAAWLLGSVAVLTQAGVAGISFARAERFRSARGFIPAYFVLSDLAAFAGGLARPRLGKHPLEHVLLDLELGSRRTTLVANLLPSPAKIDLSESGDGWLKVLDYDGARLAAAEPSTWTENGRPWTGPLIQLSGYAYARIDWGSE